MTVNERIQSALAQAAPVPALRGVVEGLTREGFAKSMIAEMFEEFIERQRTDTDFRQSDEEAIFEVLDALRGWCHPIAELPK